VIALSPVLTQWVKFGEVAVWFSSYAIGQRQTYSFAVQIEPVEYDHIYAQNLTGYCFISSGVPLHDAAFAATDDIAVAHITSDASDAD